MKKKGLIGMLLMGAASVGTVVFSLKTSQDIVEVKDKKIDKFKRYYDMLNEWLSLKQKGKSLEKYFEDNGYKSVAIYGMGEMGNRLYDELKESSIEVRYAIDKNVSSVYSELNVLNPSQEFPEVDVIVITATFAFDEIVSRVENKFCCPVISLEDVVYEV